ncbi:MAG: proliferating cell nuclear antigen (pcna) [Candidatus Lokiarchaeota archaeon]|nr:proliferating cell nuclear antigen (pcna) [Candidatus Harpocratesius repetitus]
MFKVKIKDSKMIKGIFDAISSIISETVLKVDPNVGISMTAMDISHICLVSLVLHKDDLDEFQADELYELGINLEDMVKILKRSGSSDEITFSHDASEKKLIIQMKPPEAKKARTFTMSLIDYDGEEIDVNALNNLEFDNICTFNLSYLDEAIKDAEIFAEVLQIQALPNLVFSTNGNIGDMEYVLEKEELISADFKSESTGVFSIAFLKNILKMGAIAQNITAEMRSDAPLKMNFDILNSSHVLYFLAPRVEDDDDSMYED